MFIEMRPIDDKVLSVQTDDADGWTLLGDRCRRCGIVFHPRRALCAKCGSADLQEVDLPKAGRIISHTEVQQTGLGSFIEAPYDVALIRLDGGGPIIEAVSGPDFDRSKIGVGSPIKLTMEPLEIEEGEKVATYRFVLIER